MDRQERLHHHPHRHGDAVRDHPHFHLGSVHVHPHLPAVEERRAGWLVRGLLALSGVRSYILMLALMLPAPSLFLALSYLAVFGLGITVSMTVYAVVAGSALTSAMRGARLTRWVQAGTAAASAVMGTGLLLNL